MPRKRWTDEQRADALAIYEAEGPAEAARRTGIAKGTIASWANRAGLQTDAPANLRAAVETAKATLETRHAQLAVRLTDAAEQALERELELIATGRLRDVVGVRTRAIHDALLLTGKATERHSVEESEVEAEIRALSEELAHLGAA